MAFSQSYATTGKKLNPNYVAMMNAQVPYLFGLKKQKKEDEYAAKQYEMAQKELALKEQEMLRNEELAREQLAIDTSRAEQEKRQSDLYGQQLEFSKSAADEARKQQRKANYMAYGNLGLKTGLGAYQYSEPFKNVVDKAVGGVTDLLSSDAPSGAAAYLGDAMDFGADTAGEVVSDAGSYLGDAGSSGLEDLDWGDLGDWGTDTLTDVVGGVSDVVSDIGEGIADAGNWVSDTLSDFFGGFSDWW